MHRITILALVLLTACSTTPADKGQAAGKTVNEAATQVGEGVTHLDATVAALTSLVKNPAPDLKPQFAAFDSNLSKLESTAKDVADLAHKISLRSQEYFTQWDQQLATVQNEDIRERSASRRADVEKAFQKLQKEYADVEEDFQPLLADLRDIRSALSADLTMDGLKAVKGSVSDVEGESKDVKESLQDLADVFKQLGAKLSTSGPPAPPPPKS